MKTKLSFIMRKVAQVLSAIFVQQANTVSEADWKKAKDALGVMKASFPDSDSKDRIGNALRVLTEVLNFGPNDPVKPELVAQGRDAVRVIGDALNAITDPDFDGKDKIGNTLKVLTEVLNFGPNDPVKPELVAQGRDAVRVIGDALNTITDPDFDGKDKIGNALKVLTEVLNFGPNDPVKPELVAQGRDAVRVIGDALNALPDTPAGSDPKAYPNAKVRRDNFAVIQGYINDLDARRK